MTYLIPILVGLSIVLQGTLNKQVGFEKGLTWTVFLNAIVFLIFSIIVYAAVKYWPNIFSETLRFKNGSSLSSFQWWWALPGIFGFVIVMGVPMAIEKLGASKVFILLIVSQIIFGLLWDTLVEKKVPSTLRITGAGIALFGAVLASL